MVFRPDKTTGTIVGSGCSIPRRLSDPNDGRVRRGRYARFAATRTGFLDRPISALAVPQGPRPDPPPSLAIGLGNAPAKRRACGLAASLSAPDKGRRVVARDVSPWIPVQHLRKQRRQGRQRASIPVTPPPGLDSWGRPLGSRDSRPWLLRSAAPRLPRVTVTTLAEELAEHRVPQHLFGSTIGAECPA